MINFILSVLPRIIGNSVVIRFFDFLRWFQKRFGRHYALNLHMNDRSMEEHIETIQKNNGYIEDQLRYADMVYGKATVKYSGCEVIAAFNALKFLTSNEIYSGHELPKLDFPRFIREFELDGMVLGGKFGTAPKAVFDFFKRLGYETSISTKSDQFDEIARKSRVLILTMYNNGRNLAEQVHTICITKTSEGYTAHNTYCDGRLVGPYNSVSELISNINEGKAKGISLIGINNADSNKS